MISQHMGKGLIGDSYNMGIGLIGDSYRMPPRKWRWSFEGKDAQGNVMFPECIVKISRRPFDMAGVADEDGGHIEHLPGDFTITQYGITKPTYEQDAKKCANITSGTLTLYDGCGSRLETWAMNGLCVYAIDAIDSDEEHFDVEWMIKYQSAVPTFQADLGWPSCMMPHGGENVRASDSN